MSPNPHIPTISRLRRLQRPTVYRVFLPGQLTHIRQFDHAQDAIDLAEIHLPGQALAMQLA